MRSNIANVALPVAAIAAALGIFGIFVAFAGASPVEVWKTLFTGAFGSWFSWQNTLQRSAPLMLTALCVAVPMRAGLIIIGGEGALVLGGLGCAAAAQWFPLSGLAGSVVVCLAGAVLGALWVMLAGWLRQKRGVNETISSLLLAYVATGLFLHIVEGPLRDPASLNKPSTYALAESLRIGGIGGSEVHWGFAVGVLACVLCALWLRWTPSGFALRVVGGNLRAARLVALPASGLILLAGAIEVAAVHGSANASIMVGYGYSGILVAFIARHQPLAVIPVAILFGGFGAAGSLLQRRLGLPDAAVLVLQGIAFVLILASEVLRDLDWKSVAARLLKFGSSPAVATAARP
jgi:ABC-type uncharacterized transport system permease subunit